MPWTNQLVSDAKENRKAAPCCPQCGYNLTGLTEPRCPECGGRLTEPEWDQLRTHGLALARPPHWERRDAPLLWRLPTTLFQVTFRPRQFLRGLRGDGGVLRVAWFCALLLVLAPLASVLACATLGHLSQVLPLEALDQFDHFALNKGPPGQVAFTLLYDAVRTTALIGAGWLAWLPALVALDLCQWRTRAPFRLVAKALLYTAVWWFWVGALAPGVVNELLCPTWSVWGWGMPGWTRLDARPWIHWVAAVLMTAQYLALAALIRAPQGAFAVETPATRRRTTAILTAGWLLGLYLLLFDRHVQLRFHLQFATEELGLLLRRWGFDT